MAKRMAKQMELFEPVERGFEEGGLMDEGGMVDEMSGNEVPPGSLREEVRDDIPAQLSEGEFVFPADVVQEKEFDAVDPASVSVYVGDLIAVGVLDGNAAAKRCVQSVFQCILIEQH